MRAHPLATLSLCVILAGCSGDEAGKAAHSGEEGLPVPDAARGSVTGMPNPGKPLPAPETPAGDADLPDIAMDPVDPAQAPAGGIDPAAAEPSAEAALAVLRDYYAAINARDYAGAYAQWADGGRASGQTPQQFAAGFADTAGVSVQFGAAGAVEGAAGSRYVEIPVSLEARQADGGTRRYAGSYALRLSVVDGATPEQRNWHIASGDLREVQP